MINYSYPSNFSPQRETVASGRVDALVELGNPVNKVDADTRFILF
jgi:hypothetical protein